MLSTLNGYLLGKKRLASVRKTADRAGTHNKKYQHKTKRRLRKRRTAPEKGLHLFSARCCFHLHTPSPVSLESPPAALFCRQAFSARDNGCAARDPSRGRPPPCTVFHYTIKAIVCKPLLPFSRKNLHENLTILSPAFAFSKTFFARGAIRRRRKIPQKRRTQMPRKRETPARCPSLPKAPPSQTPQGQ